MRSLIAVGLVLLAGCSFDSNVDRHYVVKAGGKSWNADPGSLSATKDGVRFTVDGHLVLATPPYTIEEDDRVEEELK